MLDTAVRYSPDLLNSSFGSLGVKRTHTAIAVFVSLFFLTTKQSMADFVGPIPYLSTSDIPANFYAGGSPTGLEDFEDGKLDFGITASAGAVTGPGSLTDSVDGDDGNIDGSGTNGRSWFVADMGNMASLTFTFSGTLPTAAGIVWTDGVVI